MRNIQRYRPNDILAFFEITDINDRQMGYEDFKNKIR